jgi:lipopolysaccharide export LptBFGC system permease protein LptF
MQSINLINRYIVKEYLKSLWLVFCLMLAVILLINLLDEFSFFKSKKDLKFTIFIVLTLLKTPNAIILINLIDNSLNDYLMCF